MGNASEGLSVRSFQFTELWLEETELFLMRRTHYVERLPLKEMLHFREPTALIY